MSAKFIDFLRNWGESLFTSKKAYIAQQSLPNTQESVITVPNDDTTHTTVSPIDGWACMNSNDGNVDNFQLFTNEIHSLISLPGTFWFRGFIPVKKGDVVNYRCSGSSSGAILRFIRSIGGGLSSIIQSGGALCLRLKNCFKRLTSSPSHKPCQQRQQRKVQRLTEAGTQSFRLSTAMRCSSHQMRQTLTHLRYSVVTLCRCHRRMLNLGLLSMFHAEKGKQYTQLLTERVDRYYALSGRLFQNNLIAKEVCHA